MNDNNNGDNEVAPGFLNRENCGTCTSCSSNDYWLESENREGGFKVCDVGAAKNITTGMHMDIGC